MRTLNKRRFRILAALLASFLLGCPAGPVPGPTGSEISTPTVAGGNPAAPPAPPAELPSALRLPASVGIDVDKTRSGSGSPTLALEEAALVGAGGTFSPFIGFSANLVYFANQRLSGLLGPLHAISIPVSPSMTGMETILLVGSKAYVARLNFADFDLDGDGFTEGCSGNTFGLPICVRAWLDDGSAELRLIEARFDAYPTEENPGAGRLRGKDLSFSGPAAPVQVAAQYNHVNPEDKFTDSYFAAIDESDPANPVIAYGIHAFASQLGPDATALKYTNGSSNDGRGLGRWLENEDYWSGSFDGGAGDPDNFKNQCAQISTGNAADPEICSTQLGIAVGDLDFVPFVTLEDVLFNDFPGTAP